jgi:hypothetical protein
MIVYGPNFQFATAVPTPRLRLDSFSAPFRSTRVSCRTAQGALLRAVS